MIEDMKKSPKIRSSKYQRRPRPEVGSRYGRLVITGLADRDAKSRCHVTCVCDCSPDEIVILRFDRIAVGRTVSCGCKQLEDFNAFREKMRQQIPFVLAVKIWSARREAVTLEGEYGEMYRMSNYKIAKRFNAELDECGISKRSDSRALCVEQQIRRVNSVISGHISGLKMHKAIEVIRNELDILTMAGQKYTFNTDNPMLVAKRDPEFLAAALRCDESTGIYRRELVSARLTPAAHIAASIVGNLTFLDRSGDPMGTSLRIKARQLLKVINKARKHHGMHSLDVNNSTPQVDDVLAGNSESMLLTRLADLVNVRWTPVMMPPSAGITVNGEDAEEFLKMHPEIAKFYTDENEDDDMDAATLILDHNHHPGMQQQMEREQLRRREQEHRETVKRSHLAHALMADDHRRMTRHWSDLPENEQPF
jgi:hypothetical protein